MLSILFCVPVVLWWGMLLDWLTRGRSIPVLADEPAELPDGVSWPTLAVVVPARNEGQNIENTIRSLASQDYPDLRIIVVEDRSTDETPAIVARMAGAFRSVQVETISSVPEGWLGKTNALWKGVQIAGAVDYLLFTDADVLHEPGTLRRAVCFASRHRIDLLTLYPGMIVEGFWERALVSYFGLLSFVGYAPWRVNNPQSGAYFAVGAFTLVGRKAYLDAGGHARLALEVVDDARLCWLMKRSGAHVRAAVGRHCIRLRWQEGMRGIVNGLTKNFFAGFNYSLVRSALGVVGLLVGSIQPFLALFLLPSIWGWLSAAAVLGIAGLYFLASRGTGISPLFFISHPAAAFVMVIVTLKSAFVTLHDNGVHWRDTYYPLQELRAARKDTGEP